ncbi:hypothetical protein OIO90_000855 [Microbotryomycetes sp. JL221]|nr:hypothetical protein OIO90_000855 [Microbotryomycetes sp. JL221]
MTSQLAQALNLITIKYLPTLAHLKYFLTSMHTAAQLDTARPAFDEIGGANQRDPSLLEHEPTLVILHNASEYLADDAEQHGIDAYASILALFTTTCSNAFSRCPFLVLHDRQVFSLELPVVGPRVAKSARQRRISATNTVQMIDVDDDDDDDKSDVVVEKMNLGDVLPYFFDWTARAESRTSSSRQNGAEAAVASSGDDTRRWFVIKYAPSKRRLIHNVDPAPKPFEATFVVSDSDVAESGEEGRVIQPVG